jgi:hypothetical protein
VAVSLSTDWMDGRYRGRTGPTSLLRYEHAICPALPHRLCDGICGSWTAAPPLDHNLLGIKTLCTRTVKNGLRRSLPSTGESGLDSFNIIHLVCIRSGFRSQMVLLCVLRLACPQTRCACLNWDQSLSPNRTQRVGGCLLLDPFASREVMCQSAHIRHSFFLSTLACLSVVDYDPVVQPGGTTMSSRSRRFVYPIAEGPDPASYNVEQPFAKPKYGPGGAKGQAHSLMLTSRSRMPTAAPIPARWEVKGYTGTLESVCVSVSVPRLLCVVGCVDTNG